MTDPSKPVLIVTRPAPEAARFVEEVRKACAVEFEAIIAPLLEIVQRPIVPLATVYPHIILTSTNGAEAANRLDIPRTAIAWCVGQRTASAAESSGFDTRVSTGSGAALLDKIIAAKPAGTMLYLRGEHVRIDIAKALTNAGISCDDIVVYDQTALHLSDAAKSAFGGPSVPILPLFSPRTAETLRADLPEGAKMQVIAMSRAVLDAFGQNSAIGHDIVESPTEPAMIAATVTAIQTKRSIKQP